MASVIPWCMKPQHKGNAHKVEADLEDGRCGGHDKKGDKECLEHAFPYCKADRAASAVMVAVEPVSKAKASISTNMVYPKVKSERAV